MDLLHYEEKPQTRGGFFWWSVFILLLTGACLASWILSFYVVAHPENPRCYRILKKLKRLDAPKTFPETQVPRGDFMTTAKLLDRFGKLGPEVLLRDNAQMLRSYLMNFRETKIPPIYLVGKFDVVESHVLGPGDLFPAGVVILAQSKESPQVLVELVFPAPPKIAPGIKEAIPTGTDIVLGRSRDLLALIHAERLDEGRMQFTAVPLPYGSWEVRPAQVVFELSSPEDLEKEIGPSLAIDVAPGLPLVRGERLSGGIAKYAEYRRKILALSREDEAAVNHGPQLVRFEASKDETEGAIAPKIIRPPTPQKPRPPVVPVPPVPLPVRPVTVAPPAATTTTVPAGTPTPVVPSVVPPAVAAVPRRVVTVREALQMAGQAPTQPQAVLAGDFIVSTVTGRRVVMKTRDLGAGTEPGAMAQVVVEFPADAKLPSPGSMLTRGPGRGFVIRNVARSADGKVVITASDDQL